MTYDAAATATATEYGKRRTDHSPSSPASPASAVPAPSPEGIGDIVLAGQPAPYPHLQTRRAPTIGRLAAAARNAAAALGRPGLWPRRRGRWQPAPRAARRGTSGRMRVSLLVLRPNEFAAVPAENGRHAAVLQLAHGRAHMVTVAPNREMQAVQELTTDRARVLGSADAHQLINTGDEPAVVVRVTG
ncbi:hypothetical protein [Streptomonospora litoralis]|uniref:Uncharacterized protein n=1 Tax=Streptomonospora litoralis TaxID=2498135 RepID=A0A4V0ZK84_9ACTN|nr:hypothetical protein [Streptomonospora litoralis]QBI56092.1 hypothetical protein EKD16_21685 [Streptomonospora litoralis]